MAISPMSLISPIACFPGSGPRHWARLLLAGVKWCQCNIIASMEGPSLVITSEELQKFAGQKLVDVSGNTKIDKDKLRNKGVTDICSWGKHLILEFEDFVVRIHFLMYGSYRVDEKKDQ